MGCRAKHSTLGEPHQRRDALEQALARDDAGRAVIEDMTSDAHEAVRAVTGVACLGWAPELGQRVLEAVVPEDGPYAFESKWAPEGLAVAGRRHWMTRCGMRPISMRLRAAMGWTPRRCAGLRGRSQLLRFGCAAVGPQLLAVAVAAGEAPRG